MNVGLLIALILGGNLLLTGGILFIVFRSVRRSLQRAREALTHEGIVLDSGRVGIRTTYRNFRAPGRYIGAGFRMSSGQVVLTQRRLVVLGHRYANFPREALGQFQVGVDDRGHLHVHTDHPPNASGTIDIHMSVSDAAAWQRMLMDAGARPLAM